MAVYINGMGNISPQQTWGDSTMFQQPLSYTGNKLNCVEPDYTTFIDAKQIRRMSRVIKMGVASAALAMKDADLAMPDGIITATGYGCLEDTGIFLEKMIVNNEQALNPTPFIQSTHNTIGSQIALLLQCQSYNQTYTQGAFSFEGALLDAVLQLSDDKEKSLLVGGIDEITPVSHAIQKRFGIFREHIADTLALVDSQEGTINGEGAAFFVLSGKKTTLSMASVGGVSTFYRPGKEDLEKNIRQFLENHSIREEEVDLVLYGKSGIPSDEIVTELDKRIFSHSSAATFKNLCGEYPVASAFALWLGSEIIKRKQMPERILQRNTGRAVRNIVIFNQYFGTHYSLILLRAC
jgi:3-oxoacyl-(acyl-carrier-protein) synthase